MAIGGEIKNLAFTEHAFQADAYNCFFNLTRVAIRMMDRVADHVGEALLASAASGINYPFWASSNRFAARTASRS